MAQINPFLSCFFLFFGMGKYKILYFFPPKKGKNRKNELLSLKKGLSKGWKKNFFSFLCDNFFGDKGSVLGEIELSGHIFMNYGGGAFWTMSCGSWPVISGALRGILLGVRILISNRTGTLTSAALGTWPIGCETSGTLVLGSRIHERDLGAQGWRSGRGLGKEKLISKLDLGWSEKTRRI